FDRSFLYGDGLFESLLVCKGKPFRWAQHIERLERGAAFLKIKLPFPAESLRRFADDLIARNQMPDGLLRLTLSRGVGVRGYSPKGADHPTLVMSLHPSSGAPISGPAGSLNAQPRWKLITATFRLPANDAVAQFKTCNKLAQILARAEADTAGADEALLLNTDGFVVEGASSNLFWIEAETVCTAPLISGILAGVTRSVILEICESLKIPNREADSTPAELSRAQGVFVTLSSLGVVEAESLDAARLATSPLIEKIRGAYGKLVSAETS
ncbi:MAG: aminodeoxychorismate lyase, partial [Akkermansiaceae bacterium]|nr:aminodeoxychorismate lyase [Verrucomicrobiales bacterium]